MKRSSVRRVPTDLAERAEAYLAGDAVAVTPKDAATVVLLRDGAEGPEAYLLRRHAQMAFAPGMYVFPGGSVDPRDFDSDVGWAGPTASEWGAVLRCDETRARALICAALRETFEESGVLLAGSTTNDVVSDTRGDDWEADRSALVSRDLSFTDFLARRRLVLRSDLLVAWAHWITPAFEPRRYDTRFFVAAMPDGQQARDVSGEADRVAWMRPVDALSEVDEGRMAMLPPTYVTLDELTAYTSSAQASAAGASRVIETVLPSVDRVDGELVFTDVVLPSRQSEDDTPAEGDQT